MGTKASSTLLLHAVVRERQVEFESILARLASDQTSHLGLFHEMAAVTSRLLARLENRDTATGDSSTALRELHRIDLQININLELIGRYAAAFRGNHPVGLSYLARWVVHELVERPLRISADLLIHLTPERNYSLVDLGAFASGRNLPISDGPRDDERLPLILTLPEGLAYSAYLSPLIAHEIGHITTGRRLFESAQEKMVVSRRLGSTPTVTESGPVGSHSDVAAPAMEWLPEILCDLIGAYVCGPSWLFALIGFIPIPNENATREHPAPSFRAFLTKVALERWGWGDFFRSEFPLVLEFVNDTTSVYDGSVGTPESYVVDRLDAIIGAVEEVGLEPLTPTLFLKADSSHLICDSFSLKYMPPNLALRAPDPWVLLLGSWVAEARAGTLDVARISRVLGDQDSNKFLLKAFELTAIARAWSDQ